VCPVKRARRSSGPVTISALAWLIVWVRSAAALRLGDHQRTDRLDGAVASFGRAAGPARLSGPGSADGVQRVGLALPAAVLAVRAVNLDHADTGRGDMAGQAGAVAAGSFDPDQADGPEPAQPPQEAGVASRAGRELPDAEQPSDGIECGGDMHVGMGACTAGNCTCFYVWTMPSLF
jgi:hypothetical protein